MNKPDAIYFINGKAFSKESLVQFCYKKLSEKNKSEFEKELFTFILDWFSPSETINANTSGSTGKPKEIQLLKKHMMASAKTTISFFNLKKKDKILLCLPMSFIAGKMMVVRALVGNLDLYFTEPSSKPEISEPKIAFSAMVPLQVSQLIKEKNNPLSNVEKLIIGGSFLPDPIVVQLQRMNTKVWQTYGMTETLTHIAVRKINGSDRSEMYSALPGVSLSLNEGCLAINAPHLGIRGLTTNDLAELDEAGKFRITGRADNVIISGGLKFIPEKIEHKISGICSANYFIGGLNDPNLDQKLVLFIEKGSDIERQIFKLWLKIEEKLEKHEVPKEIIFLQAFIKTPTGKTNRIATIRQYEMVSSSQ